MVVVFRITGLETSCRGVIGRTWVWCPLVKWIALLFESLNLDSLVQPHLFICMVYFVPLETLVVLAGCVYRINELCCGCRGLQGWKSRRGWVWLIWLYVSHSTVNRASARWAEGLGFDSGVLYRKSFSACYISLNRSCQFSLYYSHITQTDGRRRSVSKKRENRATSANCRPTSAPILADFLVGRRLFFCRSTKVKSFVDRSADFQGFCHRWSVGRWSPDDRPTFWRFFHHDIGRRSSDHRASIGRQSPDGRSMTFYQRTVGRQMPDIGRHSADDRQTVGRS